MYTPPVFKEDDPEFLHTFVRANSFATIISTRGGSMVASHLPFLFDPAAGGMGALRGHMARPNDQWRMFEGGSEVLVIFQGPHAYISPSWYVNPLNVPTWNYAVVHAYGTPSLITDDNDLLALLERTVATYESGRDHPWSIRDLPADYVEKLMKGIVGFQVTITRWEGKQKLGQNRQPADRQGAIEGLMRGGDPMSVEVARMMKEVGKP